MLSHNMFILSCWPKMSSPGRLTKYNSDTERYGDDMSNMIWFNIIIDKSRIINYMLPY